MNDNRLTLFCLVEGDPLSKAFQLTISSTETVGQLRNTIHLSKPVWFKDLEAEDLTIWRAFIPDHNQITPITIDAVDIKTKLNNPRTRLANEFSESPDDNTYIIVQRPPPVLNISQKRPYAEELDLPLNKKIRITESWKQYMAFDGKIVDLPPLWIDILVSNEYAPAPRTAFHQLKNENNLHAGKAINMPSLGKIPKHFEDDVDHGQFFVTEQMLKLWNEIRGDQRKTYRRILSGPMGVGKSYLSYFLAAKAYAEGWLVLYISDAGVLDKDDENESALLLVKRFLALNKDILTGAELEMLVHYYDGTGNIATHTIWVIFRKLLKSKERKTLLLVDEHGKLFEEKPYVPVKFRSLVPLSSYHWWGEDAKGSRLIFTGTAKFEMNILDESYRSGSVVFVGPLSRHVFSNLLDTYPFLVQTAIKREVTKITNYVPRELVNLAESVKNISVPVSLHHLEQWAEERTQYFSTIAWAYYRNLDRVAKDLFHKALLYMFVGATCTVDFKWDFFDLGLIYRSKDVYQIASQRHILCRPAQKALLELLKLRPLPAATRLRICNSNLERKDFEVALCHQLICSTKPILLNATDLNGKNSTTISLDVQHCEPLRHGDYSLGPGNDDVLICCYERYPQFDFILGRMFIQVSVSDFAKRNSGSEDIRKAFMSLATNEKNQIEKYLDDAYGSGHRAYIDARTNRFVVKKNNRRVPDIRIVYIRGSPGEPTHRELVKSFPDVLHVTFEELKKSLFRNIVTQSSME